MTRENIASPRQVAYIQFQEGDRPGARYISGQLVYDEIFQDGRLCTRYWNPNGQVWPEMHLGKLRWAVDQPADVFRLSIDRRDLSGGLEWERARVESGPDGQDVHGIISLFHAEARIEVKVHTRLDGSPFLIRWLEITNSSQHPVSIHELSPFAGLLWGHRYEEHLPPGAESPFELAYNHNFEWGREGDLWFEPLPDGRKTVDGGKKGRSGWGRPAFWARDLCNGQTFVCEFAWGGNYQFELDCQLKGTQWGSFQVEPISKHARLFFRIGLAGHDEALRVLEPGATVTTPEVHLALFQDSSDAIVQATHEHVRKVVLPAQIPGRQVEIEANHRGYLCDRENVPDILKDVDVAAAIGAELYVIDAGWYGNEPNEWWNNTGDWRDGKWMEKGGGLRAVSNYVHQKGMKFGLWVEIEAAGANSTLRKQHPEWLYRRDGVPVANGRALDFTNPEVVRFAEGEIRRLIQEIGLDMYRLDHNHSLAPAGNRQYLGFREDLTWRYYENLFDMFDRLRDEFPGVVFQNCAGGGGRLDWGTLAHFHNTELSDWMRMPRGLKILNGVSMALPPEILLRTFGTEVSEHVLEGDVDTQLRLCFCKIIFRGIAPSLEELSPYLRQHIEHYLDIYRNTIRPVMIDGQVYHHTPFLKHAEASPWCVLEYASKDGARSAAAIFRTACTGEAEYVFKPRGILASTEYEVTLDNQGQKYQCPGYVLRRDGIPVRIDTPLRSELILFEKR